MALAATCPGTTAAVQTLAWQKKRQLDQKLSSFRVRFRSNSGDHAMSIVEQRQGLLAVSPWAFTLIAAKSRFQKFCMK